MGTVGYKVQDPVRASRGTAIAGLSSEGLFEAAAVLAEKHSNDIDTQVQRLQLSVHHLKLCFGTLLSAGRRDVRANPRERVLVTQQGLPAVEPLKRAQPPAI